MFGEVVFGEIVFGEVVFGEVFTGIESVIITDGVYACAYVSVCVCAIS